jgi:hypothetical protein
MKKTWLRDVVVGVGERRGGNIREYGALLLKSDGTEKDAARLAEVVAEIGIPPDEFHADVQLAEAIAECEAAIPKIADAERAHERAKANFKAVQAEAAGKIRELQGAVAKAHEEQEAAGGVYGSLVSARTRLPELRSKLDTRLAMLGQRR